MLSYTLPIAAFVLGALAGYWYGRRTQIAQAAKAAGTALEAAVKDATK